MNPKAVALAIVAVLLVSGSFFFLHVEYPYGIELQKKIIPPKSIFAYTILPTDKLGNQTTNITQLTIGPQTNTTVEGYVTDSAGGNPIGNSRLFVAAFPDETSAVTSPIGMYQFKVIYSVSGMFAFHVPGFKTLYKSVSWNGGNSWLNLTFTPAIKHLITGTTEYANGTVFPDASFLLTGSYESASGTSGSNGKFSIYLFNDSYNVSTPEKGFLPFVSPYWLNVTGAMSTVRFVYHPIGKLYNVSGFLLADNGTGIAGGTVTYAFNSSGTGPLGQYHINVPYGKDTLIGSSRGYQDNYTNVFVNRTLTDVNITLPLQNPFGPGGGLTGTGPGGGNGSNVSQTNITPGTYSNYFITGILINKFRNQPVQNTTFEIIVNVSDTLFYKYLRTNLSGMYNVEVHFAGTYHLYYNVPGYLRNETTVTVGSSQKVAYTNLTESPLKFIVISGTVFSNYTKLPIPAATVKIENPVLKSAFYSLAITGGGGTYSISMPSNVYRFEAGAAGYKNETTEKNISANTTLDFTLIPDGVYFTNYTGTISWNSTFSSGIPGVSTKNITSNLSSGITTNKKGVHIMLTLVNPSGNRLPWLQYAFYTEVNGQYFRIVNQTNSFGQSVVSALYNGTYPFVIETLQFHSGPYTASGGNYLLTVTMNPRHLYSAKESIVNAFNKTLSLSNLSVPVLSLTLENSIVQPYETAPYFAVAALSTGTEFTFELGNASYIFGYVNSGFLFNTSNIYVHGTSLSAAMAVHPYVAELIVNSSNDGSAVLQGTSVQTTTVPFSSGTMALIMADPLLRGTFDISVYLSLNSVNYLANQSAFTLTNLSPVHILYFNETAGSVNENWTGAGSSGGGSVVYLNYSGPVSSPFIAYETSFYYNVTGTFTLYYDSNSMQVISSSTQGTGSGLVTSLLINPYHVNAGRLKITLETPYAGPVNNLPAKIYYCVTELS